MAAINAQMGTIYPIEINDKPYVTPEINEYEWMDFEYNPFIAGHSYLSGSYNAFRSTPCSLWSTSGQFSKAFFWDYYNRIHVNPSAIALGNLTSSQTRDVEIWNSYVTPNQLVSISAINAEGLNLYVDENPPTYFGALESRIYSLNISPNGPPTIDADFKFYFQSETSDLSVSGKRVTVIQEKPKYPLKEVLEWKTDVIQSYSGEQRIRLRDAPRQVFSIETVLSPNSHARLKATAFQWAHRVFAIPVWTDAIELASIAAGATTISANTVGKDFRSYDLIILWTPDSFEAIETLNVSSNSISLKLPVSKSYTDVLVLPARFANTLNGLSFSRDGDAMIKMSATYTVRVNKNLESIATFEKYKSLPVLLDKPLSSESLSDSYIRSIDIIDNGSSAPEIDTKSSTIDIISKLSFQTFDITKAQRYRQFIHYLHGRQKTFFMPSWDDEFKIKQDFSAVSTSLKIGNVNFTLFYTNRFLYVELKSGLKAFCKVLSSSTNPDGDELLSLEEPIGLTASINDVKICCLLKYVRQNTDSVQIKHDVANSFSFDMQVIEVPYEL